MFVCLFVCSPLVSLLLCLATITLLVCACLLVHIYKCCWAFLMISVFHSCLLLFDVGCFSFLSVCRLFCCGLLLFCWPIVSFLIVGVCCCLLWFGVGLLSFLLRFAVVFSSVVDDAWS